MPAATSAIVASVLSHVLVVLAFVMNVSGQIRLAQSFFGVFLLSSFVTVIFAVMAFIQNVVL